MNLRREDIETGLFEEMIQEGEKAGLFQRLPVAEREKSRRDIIAQLPEGEDIWLFAYGSLIWSPMIDFSEKRLAT
ncbi:MAG: gamma-glutamylcyclotransferase, partial [Rhodospirillales bacterium]|nr:gamma-glutamylcyclotransferase [Rhodospirillales bacterium]